MKISKVKRVGIGGGSAYNSGYVEEGQANQNRFGSVNNQMQDAHPQTKQMQLMQSMQ